MRPTRGLMSAASWMSDHATKSRTVSDEHCIAAHDARTSREDYRIAICLARGVPVDAIHQSSGHGPVRDTVTPIWRGPEQWSWRMTAGWSR